MFSDEIHTLLWSQVSLFRYKIFGPHLKTDQLCLQEFPLPAWENPWPGGKHFSAWLSQKCWCILIHPLLVKWNSRTSVLGRCVVVILVVSWRALHASPSPSSLIRLVALPWMETRYFFVGNSMELPDYLYNLNKGLGIVEWLVRIGGGLSGVDVIKIPFPRLQKKNRVQWFWKMMSMMLKNNSVDTIAVVCEERWTALSVGPDGRYFPLLPLPCPRSMSSFSLKGKRNN